MIKIYQEILYFINIDEWMINIGMNETDKWNTYI